MTTFYVLSNYVKQCDGCFTMVVFCPQVTVGYRYQQYTIGYLDYTKVWQSTEFYIGIVVAVAVLIIIIILIVVCPKLYFQAKSKPFDHNPKEIYI